MKPKISVVTVCRNEAKGIERTLTSVLNQTYKNYEYIVIDGNSNDGTKEIIQSHSAKLNHFISENDGGIYNAMNKALSRAQGEYVIFINGGDALASNDVFENVFIQALPSADIIYGDLWIESTNRTVLGKSPEKITLGFLFYSTLWHPVAFVKLELFKKYGFYDESFKLAADYDFFLNVLGKNKIQHQKVNLPIARFNTHGVGSNPANQHTLNSERRRAQKKYFSEDTISLGESYSELLHQLSQMNDSFPYRILNFLKNKLRPN